MSSIASSTTWRSFTAGTVPRPRLAAVPPRGDISAADLLLSQLADLGADLLVMGCYGQSRVRELLLGGMTRTVLRHMTVPVFMSH